MKSFPVSAHLIICTIMATISLRNTHALVSANLKRTATRRSFNVFSVGETNLKYKHIPEYQSISPRFSPLYNLSQVETYSPTNKAFRNTLEALETDAKREYNLNVGSAIEAIRHDLPHMFQQEPDLSIFTEDVTLSDRSGSLLSGKKMYSTFYSTLRIARRLTSAKPIVNILSLRHMHWKDEICVRFSVTMDVALGLEPVQFDAISVYRLNGKGLIYEHRIDDVTRNNLLDRRFENLLIFRPTNVLWGGHGQPIPMPMPY